MFNRPVAQNTEQVCASKKEREAAARAKRRVGHVVHDERGSASIEWRPAPKNYVRDPLELVEENTGFNPYDTAKP